MKIQHLQGLISAPFTPFDSNGKLDVSLIPGYYSFIKQNHKKYNYQKYF